MANTNILEECCFLSEPAELASLDAVFEEYANLAARSPIPASPDSESSDVDFFDDLTAGEPRNRELWAIAPQHRVGAYPACEAIRSTRYLSDASCSTTMVSAFSGTVGGGSTSPAPAPPRSVSSSLPIAPVPVAAAPRPPIKLRGVCKVRNSGRRANLPRSAGAAASRHAKAPQAAAAQDGFKPMSGVLRPFATVKSYGIAGGMTLQELNNKIKSSFTTA